MSSSRELVLGLVEKSRTTWDFEKIEKDLNDAREAIFRDGTLVEISKKPLINIANVALKALEERFHSTDHLRQALATTENRIKQFSVDQIEQLVIWFFKVAYSQSSVTPEIERLVKPLVMMTKNSDPTKNEKRYRDSYENYKRLAEFGTDLDLSENNLKGLIIAVRVVPLKSGVAEQIRAKCEQSLISIKNRRQLSESELAKDALQKCKKIIEPIWEKSSKGEICYLGQPDSRALHTSLFGLLTAVSAAEELVDTAREMNEEINLLRSRFEQIRFPSSTTLLARAEKEIQKIEQRLESSIDFDRLKKDLAALKIRVERSKIGKPGINWMHNDHISKALAEIQELFQKILQKETNTAAFDAEFKLFEADIIALENSISLLTVGQIKRLQSSVGNASPLIKWLNASYGSNPEINQVQHQIETTKARLEKLWTRMEAEQEQRVNEFIVQSNQLELQIMKSTELRQSSSELRELEQSISEFTVPKQPELRKFIVKLNKLFQQRAGDYLALKQLIQSIYDDIEKAHKRIYASINFDELNSRTENSKHWLNLNFISESNRQKIDKDISKCFIEIRRLWFRQEKVKTERQAKAGEIVVELQKEIMEVTDEISKKPGSPDTWRALTEVDTRLHENSKFLTDAQRQPLRQAIDNEFQRIRSARATFAAEAVNIFSRYNEILSETLFSLEENGTKEAAFEAIERIKPIRTSLRSEAKLLKRQKDELSSLLSQISFSIEEIFGNAKAQAQAQAAQIASRIRADIDNLDSEIKRVSTFEAAKALFERCKQLSSQIQSAELNMADRKECRSDIERLFEFTKERMQTFRFTQSHSEDSDSILSRLERQNYLMFVGNVPKIF